MRCSVLRQMRQQVPVFWAQGDRGATCLLVHKMCRLSDRQNGLGLSQRPMDFRARGMTAQAGRHLKIVSAAALQSKRRVRHIILPPDKDHMLPEIQAQLEAGASFEELAKAHSSCMSARRGGDLGWVRQGAGLPKALEEAIFEADIADIFTADSQHGVHILQVLDEREVAQMRDMNVSELAQFLQRGPGAAQFIDVREPAEHDLAKLPHFELLPLSRAQEWVPSLREKYDLDKETVCLCHAGIRSRRFADILLEQGFTKVYNVSGGIDAYSCLVDGKVPRY